MVEAVVKLHVVGAMQARAVIRILSQGDHPNATPFQGVLTKIDEPSDKPPNGAHGHRVLIPRDVAERKLDTLYTMAVNFSDDLDNHEAQQKVGVITGAEIQGHDVIISGHLYAKDFPEVVASLRARSQDGELGLSFEIADVAVDDPSADIWTIRDLTFTGAAILQRTAAAYESTSFIAASAAQRKEAKMRKQRKLRHMVGGVTEDLKDIRQMLASMEEEDEEAKGKKADDEDDEDAKGNPFAKKSDDEDDDDDDAAEAAAAKAAEMAALKSPGGEPPDLRKRNAGKGGKFGRDQRNYAWAAAQKVLAAMSEFEAKCKEDEDDEEAAAALNAAAIEAGMAPMSPGMNSMEMMKGMLGKVMSMLMKNYGGEDGMAPPGMGDPGSGDPGMGDPGMGDPDHADEPQDLAMLKRLVKTMETRYASNTGGAAMAASAKGGNVADFQLYRTVTQLETRFDNMEAAQGLITDNLKRITKLLTDTQAGRKNLATDQGQRRIEDGKPVRKSMAAAGAGGDTVVDKFAMMYASQDAISVAEVDKALTEAGVTDNIQRMAVKHSLADKLAG